MLAEQAGISNSFGFVVNMIDPCKTTIHSFTQAVADMVAKVGQLPATQTVFAVDTVGGITSICGPRTFSISPSTLLPFFTFSPVMGDPTSATLTLGTTDPTDATDGIMVTITAKLDDHPQVAPATNTFKIVIIC